MKSRGASLHCLPSLTKLAWRWIGFILYLNCQILLNKSVACSEKLYLYIGIPIYSFIYIYNYYYSYV